MSAPDSSDHSFFHRFVHSEVTGSVLLLICSVVALGWANSPWADSYFELIGTYVGVSWGEAKFQLSFQHWVNDFLMAIFFFVIGLEIKREIAVGELSSFDQAVLPVSAAIGGMLIPAALFLAVTVGGEGARGWGIPMATDIAFALGILSLFGKRAPLGLKVFLTALAIADDIGAVLVIALFYTETIRVAPLIVSLVFLVGIRIASRAGIRQPAVYIVLALAVWATEFLSGIHATVAGILVAMMVPVQARLDPGEFRRRVRKRVEELDEVELSRDSMVLENEQRAALEDLHLAAADMRPPGITLEHALHPLVVFLILPLFALCNAGVAIDSGVWGSLTHPIGLGILLGLVAGKQIGVVGFTWLIVRTGKAPLPRGVTWGQVWGAGCLAGVGFTMSLFISDLAYDSAELVKIAKVGIMAASLVAGVIGMLVLSRSLPAAGEEVEE